MIITKVIKGQYSKDMVFVVDGKTVIGVFNIRDDYL
jgi:hypothetical protein